MTSRNSGDASGGSTVGPSDGSTPKSPSGSAGEDLSQPSEPAVSPAGQKVLAILARLRAYLAAGEFLPGERLGDERSLAGQFEVPRSALRQALALLESEGAIRRVIGRAGGLAVADGRLERNVNTVSGLPDIARAQGLALTTRVLRVALTAAGPGDRRRLHLAEGAMLYEVRRLRSLGGTPLSVETTRVPAAMFPDLPLRDLTSFYHCLRSVYGVDPERSDETLDVIEADQPTADLLELPEGSPLVQVRRVTQDSAGRLIEWGEEIFVAERIRFHLRRQGRVRSSLPEVG